MYVHLRVVRFGWVRVDDLGARGGRVCSYTCSCFFVGGGGGGCCFSRICCLPARFSWVWVLAIGRWARDALGIRLGLFDVLYYRFVDGDLTCTVECRYDTDERANEATSHLSY